MTIESHADQVLSLVVKAGGKGDLIVDQSDAISLKALNGELEKNIKLRRAVSSDYA